MSERLNTNPDSFDLVSLDGLKQKGWNQAKREDSGRGERECT